MANTAGTSTGELLFESSSRGNGAGTVHKFPGETLAKLISAQGCRKPRLLVLMNCFSETVGSLLSAVVDNVVCIDQAQPILDRAVVEFSKTFYRCIFRGQTIKSSFEQAQQASGTL